MAHYSLMDMGEVARDSSKHTHMLGSVDELYRDITHMKRGEQFHILHIVSVMAGEDKELCLARRELYLVFLAVVERKIQKMLQLEDVIGQECSVIRLAHTSNSYARDGCPKATLLGSGELLVVVDLVVVTAPGPALLHAQLIMYRPHGAVFPLAEGGTVGKTEIPEADSLVRSCIHKQSSD